jgi:formylmethanofuran dehydrogenase subunit A
MRVFFTTDHPNGAPFTTYPEVFALLMSADKRAQWLSRLPEDVVALTNLPSIKREYTIYEIATMTRAAPRQLYGFEDRGSLGPGSVADVAVYNDNTRDRAAMFRNAAFVFKDGELVVRDGDVARYTRGKTLHVKPEYNKTINKRIDKYYDDLYGLPRSLFAVEDAALPAAQTFAEVPCRS